MEIIPKTQLFLCSTTLFDKVLKEWALVATYIWASPLEVL